MRKMIVLLLVVGLLVGTSMAILGLEEEMFGQEIPYSEGEDIEETIGDIVPCGGGSSGGGGGAPG